MNKFYDKKLLYLLFLLININLSVLSIWEYVDPNRSREVVYYDSIMADDYINERFNSAPSESMSYSDFASNPHNTDEDIVNNASAELIQSDFSCSGSKTPFIDDFCYWNEDGESNSTGVISQARRVTGANSYRFEVRNTEEDGNPRSYLTKYLSSLNIDVSNNLTLGFSWFLERFDPGDSDDFYIQLYTSDSKRIYYYMGGAGVNTTGSIVSYNFTETDQTGSWVSKYRNVTRDYEAFFGTPSSPVHLNYIYIYLTQAHYSALSQIAYLDNLTLIENGNPIDINGNFETDSNSDNQPDGWNSNVYITSYIKQSGFSEAGDGSANITISTDAFKPNLYTRSSASLNVEEINLNGLVASMDWNITLDVSYYVDGASTGIDSSVFDFNVGFRLDNGTYYDVYFKVIDAFDWITNDSYTYGIWIPNATNTWHHVSLNVNEALAYFNLTYAYIHYVGINSYIGSTSTEYLRIFIDDINLHYRRIADPLFTNPVNKDNGVLGWSSYRLEYNYTALSHDGDGSMNISDNSIGYGYIGLDFLQYRIFGESYLAFNYYLPEFDVADDGKYIYLQVNFKHINSQNTTNQFIYYVIAVDQNVYLINSTQNCFYTGANMNINSSWLSVHRNLFHDFAAAFPALDPGDFFVDELYVIMSTTTQDISFILDSIYIGASVPKGESASYTPQQPVYNEDLSLIIDTFDSGTQDLDVKLHYRINSGEWKVLSAESTDSDDQIYGAVLSSFLFEYNYTIDYYFEMIDSAGIMGYYPVDAAQGALSLIISDLTPPEFINISCYSLKDGSKTDPVEGSALFIDAIFKDEGAGVASVTLFYSNDLGNNWYNKTMNQSSILNLNALNISGTPQPSVPLDSQTSKSASETYFNFSTSLGEYAKESILIYYVIAMDGEGNVVNSRDAYKLSISYVFAKYGSWEMFGWGVLAMAGAIALSYIGIKTRKFIKRKATPEDIDKGNSKGKKGSGGSKSGSNRTEKDNRNKKKNAKKGVKK